MKHLSAVVAVALVALGLSLMHAQDASQPEKLFAAAQHKEVTDGDPQGAIVLYQQVVALAGPNRGLAAQALLRTAESYQKLGNPQARRVYEEIARDYSGRPEAVTARARLGRAQETGVARGDRAVWTGPKVDLFGRVSPDGRFISFTDWTQGKYGTLTIHDIRSNTDRALTGSQALPAEDPNRGEAQWSAFSPDSQFVAYAWFNARSSEVRIAQVSDGGVRPPRTVVTFTDRAPGVRDWSPDGKLLAVGGEGRDGTVQVSVVTVADGSIRPLKTVPAWLGSDAMLTMSFSRDSRYLAYDFPASSDDVRVRDIAIVAVDGSREVVVVDNPLDDRVAGWSPDGRHLLFTSTRTGARSLWALPVADGRPQGPPTLVRPDIGSSLSLGVTDSGVVHLHKYVGDRDVKIAPIDLNAGRLAGEPVHFKQGLLQEPSLPKWSPDGKFLVYQFRGGDDGVATRSVETGEVRRVPNLRYVVLPRWAPNSRSLIASFELRGRRGVYQVDAQSGNATPLFAGGTDPRWSADGTKIYHYANGRIRERDVRTEVERDVVIHPSLVAQLWEISPDGRYLAAHTRIDPTSQSASVLLVPLAGGETRELLRAPVGLVMNPRPPIAWTPDSRAILTARKSEAGVELVLVQAASGQVRRLDIDVRAWTFAQDGTGGGFDLSPDGRSIAFLMGKSGPEVWALENVVPR